MSAPLPEPAPRALRLTLALDAGLRLPEGGPIVVLHPRAGEDLSPLPKRRVRVVTPHAPDHAAYSAQGYACTTDGAGAAAAVLVCLPRGRAEARDLVAQAAAATAGPVILDGQKTDGIEPLLRAVAGRVTLAGPVAKAHGRIAWFDSPGGGAFGDWRAVPRQITDPAGRSFITRPGLFSADGVDPGSRLLAEALPARLRGVAVDLGAGWGWLSAALLDRAPGITALHLVEADARALDCARINLTDTRAVLLWADATCALPDVTADLIVSNPPFHRGRAAQPGLGEAFIRAAASMLTPEGQFWLVANRHLPYEAALARAFAEQRQVRMAEGYKVLAALRPRRTAAPRSPLRRARQMQEARR